MIIDKDKHPTEADCIIHTVTDGENLLDVMHIPLIRCKDCKYWDNMPVPTKIRGGTYCIKSSELMSADDFCSRGELK